MEGNALSKGKQAKEEFRKANEFRNLSDEQRTFNKFQELGLELEDPMIHAFGGVRDEEKTFDNFLKLDLSKFINLENAFLYLPDDQKRFNNLISSGMINKLVQVYFIDEYCSKDSLLKTLFKYLPIREKGSGAERTKNFATFKHALDQGIGLIQYNISRFDNTLNSYNLSPHLYKSI